MNLAQVRSGYFWMKVGGILLVIAGALTLVLLMSAQAQIKSTRRDSVFDGAKIERKPYLRVLPQGGGSSSSSNSSGANDTSHTIDLGYSYAKGVFSLIFTHKGPERAWISNAEAAFLLDGKRWNAGEAYLIDFYFLRMTQFETVKLDLTRAEIDRVLAAKSLDLKLGDFEFSLGEDAQALMRSLRNAGVEAAKKQL